MMKRFGRVAVVLGILCGMGLFYAQSGVAADISGTVHEADGTTPVTGAGVSIDVTAVKGDPCVNGEWVHSVPISVTDGSYTLSGLADGTYYLFTNNFSQSDHVNEWWASGGSDFDCAVAEPVVISGGVSVSGKDFQLDTGYSISGVVKDSSGEPITDTSIQIIAVKGNPDPCTQSLHVAWADTNPVDGTYQLRGLPIGTYYLRTHNAGSNYEEFKWWADDGIGAYDCAAAQSVVITGGPVGGIDFQLGLGGTLTGTVYQSDGITPVTGVPIQIEVSQGDMCSPDGSAKIINTVWTDTANGTYTVTGIPTGSFQLLATNIGQSNYTNEWWTSTGGVYWHDCSSAELINIDAGGSVEADFQLELGGSISGTVYQSDGVTPVTGTPIQVEAFQGDTCAPDWASGIIDSVWTDPADGTYAIWGLPPGNYNLWTYNLGQSNYLDEWWSVGGDAQQDCNAAETIDIDSGTTFSADFRLELGGSISGTVYQSDGVTPITDATIRLNVAMGDACGGPHVAWGDTNPADGTFTINGVPPETVFLTADNGWQSDYVNQWWTSGGNVLACYDAEPIVVMAGSTLSGKDFRLELGGTISGRVTELDGTTGISGMGVSVNDGLCGYGFIHSQTDSQGYYTSRGVPTGLSVYVSTGAGPLLYVDEWYDGDQGDLICDNSQPVTAGATNVDFFLEPAGVVTGTITDVGGQPLSNVCINALTPDTNEWVGGHVSYDNGLFSLKAPGGTFLICTDVQCGSQNPLTHIDDCWKAGGDTDAPVNIVTGQTTAGIDIVLEPAGSVSGRVTDIDGNPIELVWVEAYGDRCWAEFIQRTRTDSDGYYTLSPVSGSEAYVRVCTECSNHNFISEWWDGPGGMGTDNCNTAQPVSIIGGGDTPNINFSLEPGPKYLSYYDILVFDGKLLIYFDIFPGFNDLLEKAIVTGPSGFVYDFDLQNDMTKWLNQCHYDVSWSSKLLNADQFSYGDYTLTLQFSDGAVETYGKTLVEVHPTPVDPATLSHQVNTDGSIDFFWTPPDPNQFYQVRIYNDDLSERFFKSDWLTTETTIHVAPDKLRCMERGETYRWHVRAYDDPYVTQALERGAHIPFVYDYDLGELALQDDMAGFNVSVMKGEIDFWFDVRPGLRRQIVSADVTGPGNFSYTFDLVGDWYDLSTENRINRGWQKWFPPPFSYGEYRLQIEFTGGHVETLFDAVADVPVTPVSMDSMNMDILEDGAIRFSWDPPTPGQKYNVRIRSLDRQKEYYRSPTVGDEAQVMASRSELTTLVRKGAYQWFIRAYDADFDVMEESPSETFVYYTEFEGPNTIVGHVATPDGEAVSGVWVNAWSDGLGQGNGAYTNELGYFVIDGLTEVLSGSAAVDGYRVGISANGYTQQFYPNVQDPASAELVETGRMDIDFVLDPIGTVSGTAMDETGQPVQGAPVRAWSLSTGGYGEAQSLADGGYAISGLPPADDYIVAAFPDGYESQYYDRADAEEAAVLVDLTAGDVAGVDFFLVKGAVISGAVYLDSPNTPAPAGTWVEAWSDASGVDGWAMTDASGRYEISGLDPGVSDYTLAALLEGYHPAFYRDNGDGDPLNDTVYWWEEAAGIAPSTNRHLILSSGVSIRGLVSGPNGNPSAGVLVEAWSESDDAWGSAVTTGVAAGGFNYQITGLRPDTYTVGIFPEDFPSQTADNNRYATLENMTGDADGIDFTLTTEPTRSLSGTINNLAQGKAVQISAWSQSRDEGRSVDVVGTGSAAAYVIEDLKPAPDYIVEIFSADYPYRVYDNQSDRDNAKWVDLTGDDASGIDFTLPTLSETTAISGHIVFPPGISAGEYAWVIAFSESSDMEKAVQIRPADDAGTPTPYWIGGLVEAADFVVFVQSDRFLGQYFHPDGNVFTIEDAGFVNTLDGIPDTAVHFELMPGASISGVLTDPAGNGLVGIDVEAWSDASGSWGHSVSSNGGRYTIEGLAPAEDFLVRAWNEHRAYFYSATGAVGDLHLAAPLSTLDGDLDGLNMTLDPGERIAGIIRDVKGRALSGIWVSAWSDAQQAGSGAFSGQDGVYEIKGLPEGLEYRVSAEPAGTSPYLGEMYMNIPSDSQGIDFILKTKASRYTVQGTVTDANGAAVRKAVVEIWPENGKRPEGWAFTDKQGGFEIKGLEGDRAYFLEVWPPETAPHLAFYEERIVLTRDILNKTIALDPATPVNGVVADRTGAGIKGVRISVVSENGRFHGEAKTDGNGAYEIVNVPAGKTYSVSARAGGYLEQVKTGQVPSAGIDFVLDSAGMISGRVKDGVVGKFLADVRVDVYSASRGGQLAFMASAVTNEKGRYRVEGLRRAADDGSTILDYVVTASADGYPLQSKNGKKVGDSVDFTLTRGAGNRISGTIQDANGNPSNGKEFEINVFEANGNFVAFSRTVCEGGCDFEVEGLDPDRTYNLLFEGGGLSQWAGSGDLGIDNVNDATPAGAVAYAPGAAVNFRFTGIVGRSAARTADGAALTPGLVQGLLSTTHGFAGMDDTARKPGNVTGPPTVSNNPFVTVTWSPSGATDIGYYYEYNKAATHIITKRNAPSGRPANLRTATSGRLRGDDVRYYFHVAAVDDRGRIGDTATISFRIDTVSPYNLNVIAPSFTPTPNVNLALGATGATGVYLSNSGYGQAGEWENWITRRSWVLTPGEGMKNIFVQCRDDAGNTVKTKVRTTLSSGGGSLFNVVRILRILAGIEEDAAGFDDVNGDGRIGLAEVIYGLEIASGIRD
jgi:protocatechuate 3,4-dioxygenase beta subunit